MNKRVVVTGMGVISPAGNNITDFWNNLVSGNSYTTEYDGFPEYNLNSRVCGQVKDFIPEQHGLSEDDVYRMGRHTQFAMAAAAQALGDAHLEDSIDPERTGVCIANAIADTPYSEKQFIDLQSTSGPVAEKTHPYLYSKAMFNHLSTEIAARFDCRGNVFTMSTGCTGGIDAVGYSFESIKHGEVDVMICGASETPLSIMTFSSFDVIGATSSSRNDQPSKASRPFDSSRDGFVLAEGCAILVLEEYERARARGAKIYGEIVSFASYNNAFHMTDLPEDGDALLRTIQKSLDEGNVDPSTIDYINAHGSSTVQNDICEASAYKAIFKDDCYNIPISSTKSIIGHPLGAASALEIAACCLTIEHNVIHPTINLENADPRCQNLDFVPNTKREKPVDTVLTDASGFSGLHSAMIIRRV